MSALLLLPVGMGQAQGSTRIDFRMGGPDATVSFFHADMAPYGEWMDDPSYGWCWAPYDVSSDWRPYYDGHWVSTVDGWFWVTNEPWGWATYHYGRWVFDPYRGWLWIPGSVWAPAWVAWHYNDDWIGWAPLPPSGGWNYSRGLRSVDYRQIPSQGWCFVQPQHFLERRVRSVAVSPQQNAALIKRTRDVTYMGARDGRPFNRGVDVRLVERHSGRRVETRKVVEVASPERARGSNIQRGVVRAFRPELQRSRQSQRPEPRSDARIAPRGPERNTQMRSQPAKPPSRRTPAIAPQPHRSGSPQPPQAKERQKDKHEKDRKRNEPPRRGR
jgi:hypothetical protein